MTGARLRRYWIRLADLPVSAGRLGFGVTAWDREDALALLGAKVFAGRSLPAVETLIEDVDVSTLDAGHVLPNMAPPDRRGVWFPLGYAGA